MPKRGGVDYVKPSENQGRTGNKVAHAINDPFERQRIPEAERKFMGGLAESSPVLLLK
jgi:hypothetical protein